MYLNHLNASLVYLADSPLEVYTLDYEETYTQLALPLLFDIGTPACPLVICLRLSRKYGCCS